jgi:hypothetical protein
MCLGDILNLVLEPDERGRVEAVAWRRGAAKCMYFAGEVDCIDN